MLGLEFYTVIVMDSPVVMDTSVVIHVVVLGNKLKKEKTFSYTHMYSGDLHKTINILGSCETVILSLEFSFTYL